MTRGMQMKAMMRSAVAGLCLAAGCGITDPKPLVDEFSFERVENQSEITEGVSVAGFLADISFLGQAKTPTLCYGVSQKLASDGYKLTLTINIESTGSATCAQQPGGVRYTGIIRNLSKGTYTVRFIQNVVGVGTQEFTQEIRL
jgi:hypothetical protein